MMTNRKRSNRKRYGRSPYPKLKRNDQKRGLGKSGQSGCTSSAQANEPAPQPVSGSTDIIFHFYKRCFNFVWNIRKLPLRVLYDEIVKNSCSTTGSNIRNLVLLYNAETFDEIGGKSLNRHHTKGY